jgi:hypothetical protein
MDVEIQVWTLIGVVIAGGGVATFLLLHAFGSLSGRMDALGIRIDGLVAEDGHVNLTLGELVGKGHTHDRVA